MGGCSNIRFTFRTVTKVSAGLDSALVNIGNMILLKQIPQRAVINNQEKDEPEDPEQDGKPSRLHIAQPHIATVHGKPSIAFHITTEMVT